MNKYIPLVTVWLFAASRCPFRCRCCCWRRICAKVLWLFVSLRFAMTASSPATCPSWQATFATRASTDDQRFPRNAAPPPPKFALPGSDCLPPPPPDVVVVVVWSSDWLNLWIDQSDEIINWDFAEFIINTIIINSWDLAYLWGSRASLVAFVRRFRHVASNVSNCCESRPILWNDWRAIDIWATFCDSSDVSRRVWHWRMRSTRNSLTKLYSKERRREREGKTRQGWGIIHIFI